MRGCSLSAAAGTNLSTENTRAIFPMARILLRITSFRAEAVAPAGVRGQVLAAYLPFDLASSVFYS